MDVNYFLVGTQKSNYIKFKKVFSSEEGKKTVYLHLLLPEKSNTGLDSLTYNVESLGDLYSKRRLNEKEPLFLLNLSCGSVGTLTTWTFVYRNSIKDNKEKLYREFEEKKGSDLPYIIGSERYFATDSTVALAKHIKYPLKTIEILASGGNTDRVMAFLKNPSSNSKVKNFLARFVEKSEHGDEENNGFEPVLNLDLPRLMEYGGFKLEVINKKSGEKQVY
jgi:hypothetical protein